MLRHPLMQKLFLFLVFALSTFVPSSARSMYVVSVGIADYQFINDLEKTENDARCFAELYRTHTSHVRLLLGSSATHDAILAAMRETFALATADDVVVFFFSGHGTSGGLCPYDVNRSGNLLTYSEIMAVLRNCPAGNKQLFVDACFAGGLRVKSGHTAQSTFSNSEGVMLFLSSRKGEPSRENVRAANGYFTQHLIRGLKGGADADGDRIVEAREIFDFVSTRVAKDTKGKQHPVMWGKFNDDMRVMSWRKVQ